MKFIFLVLLIPFAGVCQKLKMNEVDKFTHERKIETESAYIQDWTTKRTGLSFHSIDTALYVSISGTGDGAMMIGPGDKMIFLMDNDSTISVSSIGAQDYSILNSSTYFDHTYHLTASAVKQLSEHNLAGIRKYGNGGSVTIDIPRKWQGRVKGIATLFLKEINQ